MAGRRTGPQIGRPPPAPPAAVRVAALKAAFDSLQAGDFAAALAHVRPVARADDGEAALLMGLALAGCGQPAAAAPLLVAVGRARPDALHPCLDLLALLGRRLRVREVEPVFAACLALAPDDARLWLAQAQLACELLRFEGAIEALDRSLALAPDSLPALNQRAIALAGLGRTEESLALFRRVVALDPRNAPAWANLGCTLVAEGAFEDALAAYRCSIEIRPDDPQVRLNHSIGLLKAGRMAQGWQEHEWRFRLPGHTELPLDRLLPTLAPGADLRGCRVLLTHEEGLGDTLMHLRYAPLLARAGARVMAWVPPALARLAARVEGVGEVVSADSVRLDADWHCPFISLPRAFAGSGTPWGVAPPYLHADPGQVAAAERHLPGIGEGAARVLRVGLVWGGAPRPENMRAFAIDRRRSMPLRHLAPLGLLRGVRLVSLQHGPAAAELADPPEGLALFDPMEAVADLDDTASLVRGLDVVVSVDTAVVHLAGGLGVPTILLDRYDNCWRWLHGRADSPWYPSLTIVRQARPGDWEGVVARLVPMLQRMADDARQGVRAA